MVTSKDPHYALKCINIMGEAKLMLILKVENLGEVTGGNGMMQQGGSRMLRLANVLLYPS